LFFKTLSFALGFFILKGGRKMKIIWLLICVTAIMFSITANVYSQLPPATELNAFNTYQATLLQGDQDAVVFKSAFLRNINSRPQAYELSYSDSPVEKMGQGAINTLTSWADVPKKISEESKERSLIAGCTLGLGEGVALGLARTASGVYDMATFSVSPYDRPLMNPEYKVEHPEEGFKVKLIKW
jgi:putative exosortase-associated protein (TIGR04073 family)